MEGIQAQQTGGYCCASAVHRWRRTGISLRWQSNKKLHFDSKGISLGTRGILRCRRAVKCFLFTTHGCCLLSFCTVCLLYLLSVYTASGGIFRCKSHTSHTADAQPQKQAYSAIGEIPYDCRHPSPNPASAIPTGGMRHSKRGRFCAVVLKWPKQRSRPRSGRCQQNYLPSFLPQHPGTPDSPPMDMSKKHRTGVSPPMLHGIRGHGQGATRCVDQGCSLPAADTILWNMNHIYTIPVITCV